MKFDSYLSDCVLFLGDDLQSKGVLLNGTGLNMGLLQSLFISVRVNKQTNKHTPSTKPAFEFSCFPWYYRFELEIIRVKGLADKIYFMVY